jgi:hypothetical protein
MSNNNVRQKKKNSSKLALTHCVFAKQVSGVHLNVSSKWALKSRL